MSAVKFHPFWVRLGCMVMSCLLVACLFQNLDVHAAGNFTMNIPNNSFEASNDSLTNWNTNSTYGSETASVSNVRAYDGKNSLLMEDNYTDKSLARISEKLDVTELATYTASAFAFIESGSIGVFLIFYDQNGVATVIPSTNSNPPTNQWTKISNTAEAPVGAKQVAVMIYSGRDITSKAYVDAVSIGQTVNNAGFENALTGWNVSPDATVSTTLKHGGSSSLRLNTSGSARSSDVPVSSGVRVGATAQVYLTGSSKLSIQLRFETTAGTVYMTNAFEGAASTSWNTVSVSGTSPPGTISVSLYLTTTAGAYVDDVTLDRPYEYNLGTQIWNNSVDAAVFGKDASGGTDLLYVGSNGYPSKLAVYDARTGKQLEERNLDNTEGVWGMTVATDKSVYIGTANKKLLFRYVPGTVSTQQDGTKIITSSALTPITFPSDMDIIWDVSAGSGGKIYGGTSGLADTATAGKAFQYDPNSGVTTLNGQNANPKYVRSVAYASDTELFMGMGTPAKIMLTNPSGAAPSDYLTNVDSKFVLGLDYIQNGSEPRLFAKLGDDRILVVRKDTTTPTPTGVIEKTLSGIDATGVSMIYPGTSKVYYTKGANLYSYDIADKLEVNLGDAGGSAIGYAYLTENGTTRLYAALSTGKILKYDKNTSTKDTTTTFSVPKTQTKIRSLVKGPSDKIYTGGYLHGGLGIYDPDKGLLESKAGAGQAENMTTSGANLYMGIYPGALIKRFDTLAGWNGTTNPSLLFQSPGANLQDRPFGMLAVPSQQRLYVGTVASTGSQQGAFTVYDLNDTNPSPPLIQKGIVSNQSVISLAFKGNKVYGGTSIYGGLGSTNPVPPGTEGKVFVWDTNWNTNPSMIPNPVPQSVPAPNRTVISDLIEGPDGLIWGLAEGNSLTASDPGYADYNQNADLFTIDPSNGNKVVYGKKFNSLSSVNWVGGKMVVGNDGQVYVSIGGKLYSVNPSDKEVKELISSGVWLLTSDKYGDLYYVKNELNLYKYDK
ncbi:carbohydrate binding domain-containing protein [Paenibacillus sp. GCM10027628]|uniref:carbohydrate binding domain-containing protein n=1 Tax=Paenibacillus sp. GCM10027628 TaxID=3273413 RepID=UPI003624E023